MLPNTNPAEFMLDLVNNEFTDPASVTAVINVWDKKSAQTDVDASRRTEVTTLPTAGSYPRPLLSSTGAQFVVYVGWFQSDKRLRSWLRSGQVKAPYTGPPFRLR